jgi:hypothetical protein
MALPFKFYQKKPAKTMNEIWRDIPGFEGIYMVSDYGQILSVRRKRLLSPNIGRNKYQRVALQINRERVEVFVHRIVAMAFIPNPDNMPVVNHLNGNRFMNRVTNLEWVNFRENETHRHIGLGSSHYPGVTAKFGKWQARICVNKKSIYLGLFDKEIDAAKAYRDALTTYNLKNKYAEV